MNNLTILTTDYMDKKDKIFVSQKAQSIKKYFSAQFYGRLTFFVLTLCDITEDILCLMYQAAVLST